MEEEGRRGDGFYTIVSQNKHHRPVILRPAARDWKMIFQTRSDVPTPAERVCPSVLLSLTALVLRYSVQIKG